MNIKVRILPYDPIPTEQKKENIVILFNQDSDNNPYKKLNIKPETNRW